MRALWRKAGQMLVELSALEPWATPRGQMSERNGLRRYARRMHEVKHAMKELEAPFFVYREGGFRRPGRRRMVSSFV